MQQAGDASAWGSFVSSVIGLTCASSFVSISTQLLRLHRCARLVQLGPSTLVCQHGAMDIVRAPIGCVLRAVESYIPARLSISILQARTFLPPLHVLVLAAE